MAIVVVQAQTHQFFAAQRTVVRDKDHGAVASRLVKNDV